MKILRPKLSGFCPGVKRAEIEIFKLKNGNPGSRICVLGELIHNAEYINYLSSNNIISTENIDSLSGCDFVIIRTHGIPVELEKKLTASYKTVDLTCPKVKKLQMQIKKYSDNGYTIIISGKKDHAEVIGLVSYAQQAYIVEDDEDYIATVTSLNNSNKPILIVSQTTAELQDLMDIVKRLRHDLPNFKIEFFDTICQLTSQKEKEALELQKEADASFVIGDVRSSNAKKLHDSLNNGSPNVYFISNLVDLFNIDFDFSKLKSALVVSSASTPAFIENDITTFLEKL